MPDTRAQRSPTAGVWLLIIWIVVMAQYVITGWIRGYGSNPDIVSHVGFAGTIVSTILALLAIVYAYYQTFAQQRDSASIESQITVMRHVVEEIRDSRRDLSSELDRFSELSTKLDRTILLGETSQSTVLSIADKISEMERRANKNPSVVAAPGLVDRRELARLLAQNASYHQLAMYLAFRLGADRELAPVTMGDKIVEVACSRSGMTSEAGRRYVVGTFVGQWQILLDLGLASASERGKRVSVSTEFIEALDKRLQSPPPPPPKALVTIEAVREVSQEVETLT